MLGAGLALDVALHLTAALTAGSAPHDGGVATAIHGLVLAGMAVTFAGLLQVAFRPQGTVTRKETR